LKFTAASIIEVAQLVVVLFPYLSATLYKNGSLKQGTGQETCSKEMTDGRVGGELMQNSVGL
jgi:hypothetical protein